MDDLKQKILYIETDSNDSLSEFIIFDLESQIIYDPYEDKSISTDEPIKNNPISMKENEEMYEDYLTMYSSDNFLILNEHQFNCFINFKSSYISKLNYRSFIKKYSLEEWLI